LVDSTIDAETLAGLLADDRSIDAQVDILGKSTVTGGLLLSGSQPLPEEDRRHFFPTEDEKKDDQTRFDADNNRLFSATEQYARQIEILGSGSIRSFAPHLSFDNVDFYPSSSRNAETGPFALVVRDTVFRRPIIFSNCHFHGPVLVATTLMRNSGILGVGFGGLIFIDCKFDGAVSYENVYMEPDPPAFQRSEFFDKLLFQKCMVLRSDLTLQGCTFHKRLEADNSQIEAALQFSTCNFLPDSQAVFTDCEIDTVDDWNTTLRVYQGEFQYNDCNIG